MLSRTIAVRLPVPGQDEVRVRVGTSALHVTQHNIDCL